MENGDRFGQALTELWMREGVDASRIVVNGGAHTGLYFVTHSENGHEFSYMRAGSAASRIGESDLPVDRIRDTKILHVSGISQAISSSAADAAFAAARFANVAASLSTLGYGAVAPLPRRADVEAALKSAAGELKRAQRGKL